MRKRIFLAGLIFGIVASVQFLMAVRSTLGDQNLTVKFGDPPKLPLQPRPAITEDQARHIKDLIGKLAELEQPDFGLSPTLSGSNFAAIAGQEHASVLLLTNHGLATSSPFKELVSLGPDALPFLIDSLDDQSPTKLVIGHDGFIGAMWFSNQLGFNPVNPIEHAAYKEWVGEEQSLKNVRSYTVKVGDVCFVILGQIVGRNYLAVRYQPTACVVLTSTAQDAKLCAQVRAIWKSQDPRQKLFDSLCADYSTVGIFDGKSLDGWEDGNEFQCAAALRLLFYFPKETTALLVRRLESLDVSLDIGLDGYMNCCVANQVRSDEFIKSVAWSTDPDIRKSLTGLFQRAGGIDILLAALPGVADKELIHKRLEGMVNALPAADATAYGDGYHLLAESIQQVPDLAKEMVDQYLKNRSAARCITVCLAMRAGEVSWETDIMVPMLSDTRKGSWDYAVLPGKDDPGLTIRVCDEAAIELAGNHRELKFSQSGQYADMDKQIEELRMSLSAKKP